MNREEEDDEDGPGRVWTILSPREIGPGLLPGSTVSVAKVSFLYCWKSLQDLMSLKFTPPSLKLYTSVPKLT